MTNIEHIKSDYDLIYEKCAKFVDMVSNVILDIKKCVISHIQFIM